MNEMKTSSYKFVDFYPYGSVSNFGHGTLIMISSSSALVL